MSLDGGWCRVCGKWEMEADEGYCEEHTPLCDCGGYDVHGMLVHEEGCAAVAP